MANSLARQITEEGPRNAVVKLTGVLEDSNIYETPAISVQDFTNNDPNCTKMYGFRVDLIEYSISNGVEVQLEWNALRPQIIMPLAGRGRIVATNYGGFIPEFGMDYSEGNVTYFDDLGFDGSINLKTVGFDISSSPQVFTVILELVKLYIP